MRARWLTCGVVLGLVLCGAGLLLRQRLGQHLADEVRTGHAVTGTVIGRRGKDTKNIEIKYLDNGVPVEVWLAQFDGGGPDYAVGESVTVVTTGGTSPRVVTTDGYTSQKGYAFILKVMVLGGLVVSILALMHLIVTSRNRRRRSRLAL